MLRFEPAAMGDKVLQLKSEIHSIHTKTEELMTKIMQQQGDIKKDFPQHRELLETAEEKLELSTERFARISDNLALFAVSFRDAGFIHSGDGKSAQKVDATLAAELDMSYEQLYEKSKIMRYYDFLSAVDIQNDALARRGKMMASSGTAPGARESSAKRFEKYFNNTFSKWAQNAQNPKLSKDEYATKLQTLFATRELLFAIFNCDNRYPVMDPKHKKKK